MKLSFIFFTPFLATLIFVSSFGKTFHFNVVEKLRQKSSPFGVCVLNQKSICFVQNKTLKLKNNDDTAKNIIQKNIIKSKKTKVKEQNLFLKTYTFLKYYVMELFSFKPSDDENHKKNEISLFPLLKEGAKIILSKFRS